MERTAGVETWRNGGTERRTRVDAEARGSGGALPCVQTWRHGVMELWGSTVGVETGSHAGLEALQAQPREGIKIWDSGAREAYCRRMT